jgi:hypothetical protein
MRGVWQHYDALATDGEAPLAHASSPSSYPPSSAWSPHVLLGVSVQILGMGVPAGDSQLHLHSHHNWGSIAEMVVTAASAMRRT